MKILSLVSTNATFQFVCAMACLASLTACSVEASSPNPYVSGPPPISASKAVGMEGSWASDCIYDQGGYTRQTMSLHDNIVSVRTDIYYRSDCALTPKFSAKSDGTLLRFGSSFWVTGGHDIEVTTLQSNGTSKIEKAVFMIENGVLYTSDKKMTTSGQWPTSIDRTRPFYYIGG